MRPEAPWMVMRVAPIGTGEVVQGKRSRQSDNMASRTAGSCVLGANASIVLARGRLDRHYNPDEQLQTITPLIARLGTSSSSHAPYPLSAARVAGVSSAASAQCIALAANHHMIESAADAATPKPRPMISSICKPLESPHLPLKMGLGPGDCQLPFWINDPEGKVP